MRNAYLASEFISAVIILILLYANIYELKLSTEKSRIFTRLLVLNEIVVLTDAITWLPLYWSRFPHLLGALVLVTYIAPFLVLGTFSQYIYTHISSKIETRSFPFKVISLSTTLAGIVFFLLCLSGKMFEIRGGIYYPGLLDGFYYLYYVVSLLFIAGVILAHQKKLGLHDLIGALSFCLLPLVSVLVSTLQLGFNLAVPSISINMLAIYVLLQSESEGKLLHQSNFDEQTGLYNRRAYEDALLEMQDNPFGPDFVYASIDINSLKQVNDTLGHAAGDELICAAAACLTRTFGHYGQVYRIGGDEFAAMLHADNDQLKALMEDLKQAVRKWHGQLVDTLSISTGSASRRDYPNASIQEMSKIADQRMYEEKEQYYRQKGVDRRGKALAHTALCNLYTKILKINLTRDSYTIINMDPSEQTGEKAVPVTISDWLYEFGRSGQVHPDDLEDYLKKTSLSYLKKHFSEGRPAISIFYRRRYPDGFKQVTLEMIPADDYAPDNQSLFLYVKTLDL